MFAEKLNLAHFLQYKSIETEEPYKTHMKEINISDALRNAAKSIAEQYGFSSFTINASSSDGKTKVKGEATYNKDEDGANRVHTVEHDYTAEPKTEQKASEATRARLSDAAQRFQNAINDFLSQTGSEKSVSDIAETLQNYIGERGWPIINNMREKLNETLEELKDDAGEFVGKKKFDWQGWLDTLLTGDDKELEDPCPGCDGQACDKGRTGCDFNERAGSKADAIKDKIAKVAEANKKAAQAKERAEKRAKFVEHAKALIVNKIESECYSSLTNDVNSIGAGISLEIRIGLIPTDEKIDPADYEDAVKSAAQSVVLDYGFARTTVVSIDKNTYTILFYFA